MLVRCVAGNLHDRLAPLQPHPEGPSGAALAGIVQPLAGNA
jgi:hypothetical protein